MKKITEDKAIIDSIIQQASVCRIAMCEGDRPYVVPVSFGYEDGALYFHSSTKGRKLDILRGNNAVCFEFDVDREIVRTENACQWSVRYRSVIGFGRAFFVENLEEKRRALDTITAHYGGQPHDYPDATLRKMAVVKIEIERATGKVSGY